MTHNGFATGTASAVSRKSFAVRFRDLKRWSVDYFRRVEWAWPAEFIKPIGDVVTYKRNEIDTAISRTELPIIEKISFGGVISITPPERRAGYKGRLFWAETNDLIYSKIRAKQGSLTVVPNSIKHLAVSAEYPVYHVDDKKADGRYLELVMHSQAFLRLLDGFSHGGSTKTRIPPEIFEKLTIPIPPLPIQRQVVSLWEQARARVTGLHEQIAALETQIESDFLTALGLTKSVPTTRSRLLAVRWKDIDRWAVMFNQLAGSKVDMGTGKYPTAQLGDVGVVSYGIQKSPANRPGSHARPYLRVANVLRGTLDLREIKTIDVPDSDMPSLRLELGDLLFVEGNGSRQELGRCAIWGNEIEDCVHQNHILRVRLDQTRVLPEFSMIWFNTELGKDHFFRSVKTSSGLGTINSTELRAAPIPIPSLDSQRQLIATALTQRKQIEGLKTAGVRFAEKVKVDVEDMILGIKQADPRM